METAWVSTENPEAGPTSRPVTTTAMATVPQPATITLAVQVWAETSRLAWSATTPRVVLIPLAVQAVSPVQKASCNAYCSRRNRRQRMGHWRSAQQGHVQERPHRCGGDSH